MHIKCETGQQLSVVLLLQSNMGSQLHTYGNISTLLRWEEWQMGGLTILVQQAAEVFFKLALNSDDIHAVG